MKIGTLKQMNEFVTDNHEKIEKVKVTKIIKTHFNDMEGNNYLANVKIITPNGYKNKLLQVTFNDSYLEWYQEEVEEFETVEEWLQEYFNILAV